MPLLAGHILQRNCESTVSKECNMAGIRLPKRAMAALLVLTASSVAQSPRNSQPKAISTTRASDSYAIYSLLMPGEPFQSMSPDQAQHLAVADTTVNIEDMNPAIAPDSELQPPPDNEKAFHEAVQDFRTRRYERAHLDHQLKMDRDYTLVSADDVAELRKTLAGIDHGSQLKDKWAGYPGITFFSEVYFDSAQKVALVFMNNFCANLCANGQWIYLEKQDSGWVRRSGLNT
jgi:hypothetical protein